jgi:hypothetical protein
MQSDGRRAGILWLVLAALVVGAVGAALLGARDAWFGAGPAAIHDASALRPRIHLCGRDYQSTERVIPRAAWPLEAPFPLVEPAPFAGCTISVDDPSGFCAANRLACGTYTVVAVRIGDDAYVPYELVGGP